MPRGVEKTPPRPTNKVTPNCNGVTDFGRPNTIYNNFDTVSTVVTTVTTIGRYPGRFLVVAEKRLKYVFGPTWGPYQNLTKAARRLPNIVLRLQPYIVPEKK